VKSVLFVCTHNAGRSQMAQAFFERDCAHDCRAESAGSDPVDHVWPEVVEVMREVGFDLAGVKPKRLSVEMQLHADWAVTMGCGDVCPYVPTCVDDWDIPDRAGRSADEVREILLPGLVDEFGATRTPEVIRGCADRILDQYDDVRIRSHIRTLVTRQARDCLRHERCEVLEALPQ
jgi:arsenate reductase